MEFSCGCEQVGYIDIECETKSPSFLDVQSGHKIIPCLLVSLDIILEYSGICFLIDCLQDDS